jgi:hypothetical protein
LKTLNVAAENTAQASVEIDSIEEDAQHSASAIAEIGRWIEQLSKCATDLKSNVNAFFAQVRAA